MTRKDYETIARILKEHRDSDGNREILNDIAKELAAVFVEDNPRFLPHRFFVACGLTQYEV
jgi:hypothetical protein